MISQPTPKIRCKNTANLKQRHENANICRRKLFRLQIQTPIRYKSAYKKIIDEVKTGKIGVEVVAQIDIQLIFKKYLNNYKEWLLKLSLRA